MLFACSRGQICFCLTATCGCPAARGDNQYYKAVNRELKRRLRSLLEHKNGEACSDELQSRKEGSHMYTHRTYIHWISEPNWTKYLWNQWFGYGHNCETLHFTSQCEYLANFQEVLRCEGCCNPIWDTWGTLDINWLLILKGPKGPGTVETQQFRCSTGQADPEASPTPARFVPITEERVEGCDDGGVADGGTPEPPNISKLNDSINPNAPNHRS